MQRPLFVLPLVFCAALTSAQERTLIGFQLGNYLRTADPDHVMSLYLEGSTSEVDRAVKEHGGTVVMKLRNWTSVRIPAGRLRELEQEPAVRSIQGFGYGQTLNDSMRVKTRIDQAQQGMAPLPRGYDGKGVVIGIVDTGMDLNHPDMRDSTGTRVLHFWDHHQVTAENTPPEFGFGQEWSKDEIDNGDCPLQFTNYAGETDGGGHGTTVAGTAAGNGGNSGQCVGAAPKADLIIVSAVTVNNSTFLAEVTDGVKYIFDHATALGRPAVVNLSLGSYLGSHDGLDPSALFIDSMITAAPGRSVVCAVGNSGCFPNYHLRMQVDGDTLFSWIRTNTDPNNAFGGPFAYIDFWGDTAAMNNISFSVGADREIGGYAYRGRIPFHNVQEAINTVITDALVNDEGDTLAVWSSLVSVRGGQYNLEIITVDPDSADYNWRIIMTGEGQCDAWDNQGFGLSEIPSSTSTVPPPSVEEYAPMVDYVLPTIDGCIVDSWACSPHVIGVANYNNEQQYTAINGTPVDLGGVEGDIAFCSAWGPTRTGLQKPDIAAPGDVTFSAIPLYFIDIYLQNQGILRLSADTMHVRAGGTSIASPAVTGAVALYFQKCPYHTQAQAMAALTGAAFPDDFTGDVPNYRFGHGKLDAFTPLVGTNFDVNVSSNDLLLCPGDSSEAMGPAGFEDYLWSDGSTTQMAWSVGEPMVLTVLNEDGCISNSDTLIYTVFPDPDAPVITDAGGMLGSTPADGYQWYLNGNAIPGATDQYLTTSENGDYTVVITGPGGCTAESDSYTLLNTAILEGTSSGFRMWPVPANGTLFVTVEGDVALAYEILDASGRTVKRGALRTKGTSVLDIAALAPGTYSMRTSDGARNAMRTFVVR